MLLASWNRLRGRRLRFFLFSVLFWIAAPASTIAISVGGGGYIFLLWLFLVFIIAPILGRFFAMSIVQGYLNIARGVPLEEIFPRVKDIFRTGALSMAPFFAGLFLSTAIMVGLTSLTDLSETGWGILFMLLFFGPFAFFLPISWAANPFWVDRDEGFFEGLRNGVLLIKSDFWGAMKVTAAMFGLTIVSGFVLFSVADFWSKSAFTEAYLRAGGLEGQ